MEAEDISKRSLLEQIYDELFANIEKHNEFDEGLTRTIKQLATNGELKKHQKVVDVLRETGEKNETSGTGN